MAANISRRNFLAAGVGLPAVAADPGLCNPRRQPFRAVAFDALVLFDLRHVGRLAEQLFPGTGTELFREWRTRQFEYAWLRTITGHYVDFWQITSDALITAAEAMKLRLPASDLNSLLSAYLDLRHGPT